MTPRAQTPPTQDRGYQETHQQQPSPQKQSPLRPPVGWDISSQPPIPYQHLGPAQHHNMKSRKPSQPPVAEATVKPGQTKPSATTSRDRVPDVNKATASPASPSPSGPPPAKRRRQDIPQSKKNTVARKKPAADSTPSARAPRRDSAPPQQAQSAPPKVASQANSLSTKNIPPIVPGLPVIDTQSQANFHLSLPSTPSRKARTGDAPPNRSVQPPTQASPATTGPSKASADVQKQPGIQSTQSPVPKAPFSAPLGAISAQARSFRETPKERRAVTRSSLLSTDNTGEAATSAPSAAPTVPSRGVLLDGTPTPSARAPRPAPVLTKPPVAAADAQGASKSPVAPAFSPISPVASREIGEPARSVEAPTAPPVRTRPAIPSADAQKQPISKPTLPPVSPIRTVPSNGFFSGALATQSAQARRLSTPSEDTPRQQAASLQQPFSRPVPNGNISIGIPAPSVQAAQASSVSTRPSATPAEFQRQQNLSLQQPIATGSPSNGSFSGGVQTRFIQATQTPPVFTTPSTTLADNQRQQYSSLQQPIATSSPSNRHFSGGVPARTAEAPHGTQVLGRPFIPAAVAQQQPSSSQRPFAGSRAQNGNFSRTFKAFVPVPQNGQIVVPNAQPQVIPPSINPQMLPGLLIPPANPLISALSSLPNPPNAGESPYGNLSGAFPVQGGGPATLSVLSASRTPSFRASPVAPHPSSSSNIPRPSGQSVRRQPTSPVYNGVFQSRPEERLVTIPGTHIFFDTVTTFLRRFVRLNSCLGPNPLYPTGGQVHRETMFMITALTIEWQSSFNCECDADALRWAKEKGNSLGLAIFDRARSVGMLYLMKGIRQYFNDMANLSTTTIHNLIQNPKENENFQENGFLSYMGNQMMDEAFFTALVDNITMLTRRVVLQHQALPNQAFQHQSFQAQTFQNQAGVARPINGQTGLQPAVPATTEAGIKKSKCSKGQEYDLVVEHGFTRRVEKRTESQNFSDQMEGVESGSEANLTSRTGPGTGNETQNTSGMTNDQLMNMAKRALGEGANAS